MPWCFISSSHFVTLIWDVMFALWSPADLADYKSEARYDAFSMSIDYTNVLEPGNWNWNSINLPYHRVSQLAARSSHQAIVAASASASGSGKASISPRQI